MNNFNKMFCSIAKPIIIRNFSVSAVNNGTYPCKLLIIGGGTGGCTMAAKFARKFEKKDIFVLEPSMDHYYQPLWTLVGAGVKTLKDTHRTEKSVMPSNVTWLKDSAVSIDPEKCVVSTKEGHDIQYEYVIVATGLSNAYDMVPGLLEALDDPNSGVSTIYSSKYCEKTWSDIKSFQGGEAIFTYPNTPIKCPGAPQKIAYMAAAYFTMNNIRAKTNITYNTCLPVIFGVKKYADALMKVVERKGISVNYKTVLKEVRHEKKEAVFFHADTYDETVMPYTLLHVTPPMRTPSLLSSSQRVADQLGFLEVNKHTLQHVRYPNVFGIGDCTNTPNSKTAAAIAKQSYVLEANLLAVMEGRKPEVSYNGYGACPLVTEYGKCIIAEFLYDGVPHETLPFDQSRESTIAYYMKKDLFPFLYWNLMLKGYYNGPEVIRRIINPLAK